MSPSKYHNIGTSHGVLAVEEAGAGDIPVLLIHGNSSCRSVFGHQLKSQLAKKYRLIAFDLPGHGDSENAPDPHRSYTLPGFADAASQLLSGLGVTEVILCGWSLGGHIAIEMLARISGVRGLVLMGSPPIRKQNGINNIAEGFNARLNGGLAGKEVWSHEEVESFVHGIIGSSAEPFLYEAAARADGRFRKRLFEASREGLGVDQRSSVERADIPIAIINGAQDPIVRLDYFDTVEFRDLWRRHCYRLPGLGHVPFWQGPEVFNPLLEQYLRVGSEGSGNKRPHP